MDFSSAPTTTFADAIYLFFPKDIQVIFTVPVVFGVTTPLDETVAIFVFEDL